MFKKINILRVSPFLLLLAGSVFGQGLEEQISQILRDVFQIEKFSVTVRSVEFTEIVDLAKEKRNILPAVPVEERLGEGKTSKELVKKTGLIITVILPMEITLDIEKRIENLIKTALNLSEMDVLRIVREDFASPPEASKKTLPEKTFLESFVAFFYNPANTLLTIFAILLLIFLWGPVRGFFSFFGKIIANSAGGASRAEPYEKASQPETISLVPQVAHLPKEGEDAGLFSFVDEKNISKLAYLMKDSPSEEIAAVVGFLNEPLVEKFLSFFPPEKQSDILSFLIYEKELPQEKILSLEKRLKEKVNFVAGGTEHLLRMLENSPVEVQEQFLSHIAEEDAILATQLRNSIFRFDDLARQDASVLSTVLRFVNTKSLAKALQFAASETKDRLLNALSEGARAIVKEEMELQKENQRESLAEQRKIVQIVRRLQEAGTIELR